LTDPLESTSTPPAARSTTTRKRAPGLAISFILVHPPSKHGLSERIHFQALFHRSLALSAGPLPRPTFLSTPRARRGVSSQRRPGVARRGGRETYTERPSRPRSLPPRLGAPLPPRLAPGSGSSGHLQRNAGGRLRSRWAVDFCSRAALLSAGPTSLRGKSSLPSCDAD